MALTKTVVLQGATPTTVEATDYLAFHNGTFGQPITVGEFNGGTSVRASGGTDDSASNTPKNSKYIASGTVDIGGGTVALNTISTANCPLKITLTESVNITVTNITMYAYDGTTPANAPTDMEVYLAEQGDSAWVQAHGSGSALTLGDSTTPATTHNFYVLISVKPTSVGVKSANKTRFAFTYQ